MRYPNDYEEEGLSVGVWLSIITLAVVIGVSLLWLSEVKDEKRMSIAECVERSASEDGFGGTLQEAWGTYSNCY